MKKQREGVGPKVSILQTLKKLNYILLAVFVFFYFFSKNSTIKLGPGVKAAEDPQQVRILLTSSFKFKDYEITPLADFSIKAKVLSKKNYSLGREADISPVDLALGWGNMSDEEVLKSIKIWQRNRWYWWKTRKFPIPRREIETHSANMHIIPADDEVRESLKNIRRGDIVEFKGSLVKVIGKDGWRWFSSLTRDDTGGHSCELVWVDDLNILNYD